MVNWPPWKNRNWMSLLYSMYTRVMLSVSTKRATQADRKIKYDPLENGSTGKNCDLLMHFKYIQKTLERTLVEKHNSYYSKNSITKLAIRFSGSVSTFYQLKINWRCFFGTSKYGIKNWKYTYDFGTGLKTKIYTVDKLLKLLFIFEVLYILLTKLD